MSDMFCEDCRRTTSGRCARHSNYTVTVGSGQTAVMNYQSPPLPEAVREQIAAIVHRHIRRLCDYTTSTVLGALNDAAREGWEAAAQQERALLDAYRQDSEFLDELEREYGDIRTGAKTVAELKAQVAAAQQERARLVSVDDVLAIFKRWHDAYPLDVFPPDGKSKDCHSAAMGRHMALTLRSEVLELLAPHPPPTADDR